MSAKPSTSLRCLYTASGSNASRLVVVRAPRLISGQWSSAAATLLTMTQAAKTHGAHDDLGSTETCGPVPACERIRTCPTIHYSQVVAWGGTKARVLLPGPFSCVLEGPPTRTSPFGNVGTPPLIPHILPLRHLRPARPSTRGLPVSHHAQYR